MKRVISLVLTLMFLMGSVSACATEPRESEYFDSYGASLSRMGSGKIKIFSCSSVGVVSQLGVSNFSVYRYDDSNGYWDLVSNPHSGSYGYNTSSYSFSRTFNGVAGERYRVKTSFTCVKNNSSETKNHTSGSIVAN